MHSRDDRRFERMPRVVIDRGALQRNWRTLANIHPRARTGAAVKADGYGLGAAPVAEALYEAGCRDFFVAWPAEGLALRHALTEHCDEEARIFVLQGIEPSAVETCVEQRLVPVLSNLDDLGIWSEELSRLNQRSPAALQFETGMNRLGIDAHEIEKARSIVTASDLDLALVLSHLASADEAFEQTEEQRLRFLKSAEHFPGVPRSLANSAGTYRGDAYAFDLTRPGIALYGGRACLPADATTEPVVTLTAVVLQVRDAAAGERAGYGGAAYLDRKTRIATIGIGYGDGYPRALSGSGVPVRETCLTPSAFLAGRHVPILGRISMDLTLLDITDLPEDAVKPGDRAEFFGPNVAIDDVARSAGTIAYELLTGLKPRVYRSWSGSPIPQADGQS